MSDPKHTPGPWFFAPDETDYADEAGRGPGSIKALDADGDEWFIARINESPGDGDTEVNARLIAAAPELYELLESIENDTGTIPAGLWRRIQETLAKANPSTQETP